MSDQRVVSSDQSELKYMIAFLNALNKRDQGKRDCADSQKPQLATDKMGVLLVSDIGNQTPISITCIISNSPPTEVRSGK